MESTATPKRLKAQESPNSAQTLEISNSTSDDIDDQMVEEEEENEDRISNLPESVIGLILSKLPTKCAIATAVLSTRWRYLFSSIPNPIIEFDDSATASFINFVPRLFNNILPQFPVIQELSLILHQNYRNQQRHGVDIIEEWLSTAPPCNLHRLRLSFFREYSEISSLDVLRPFTSSLRTLLLSSCHSWHLVPLQSSTLFPNLTSLHICGAQFLGLNSFQRALAACPKLRDLTLSLCRYAVGQDVSISVPSLRTLSISRCYSSFSHNYHLLLDTPDLESLVYVDYVAQGYPVLNSAGFRSLSEAIFDNVKPYLGQWNSEGGLVYTQNVANLLAACYNVKTLCFNVMRLKATFTVPTFRNLKTLEYGVHNLAGWEILPKFLHHSPILQVLKISKVLWNRVEGYERFQSCLPESVPICLSSHLSEIVFEVLKVEKSVLKLVKYFLRTAQVLEKMSIRFNCYLLSHEKVMGIQQDILTSPVCSTNCQIDIVRLNEDK